MITFLEFYMYKVNKTFNKLKPNCEYFVVVKFTLLQTLFFLNLFTISIKQNH